MSNEERLVFDTNVLISALLFSDSVLGRAVFQCLEHGTILLSQNLAEELSDVLNREKFNRYVTLEERERFLEALVRESELVEITEKIDVCRDPKDDQILELAMSGKASCIVTGDQDLLVLNPFRMIPIVTPAEFLNPADEAKNEG